MGRSIKEIKDEMCREFMRNEGAAERYGFAVGSSFSDRFGAASVENILLYVWAVCAWSVEQLLEGHRAEVNAALDEQRAHRPKWYRDKVLGYMHGHVLMEDSDVYDTEGMSAGEIAGARVVRHAVAVESRDASMLIVKVAGERGGERCPLSEDEERGLGAYLGEIKDAGVRIALVNREGDQFGCDVDVYYDPLLEGEDVRGACEVAIGDYIGNLPFNGEYTNMALVDALQGVEGVRIAELRRSYRRGSGNETVTEIDARATPEAGYFRPWSINVRMKAYNE